MDKLLLKQDDMFENINKLFSNYKKSPKDRLKASYIKGKLKNLKRLFVLFTKIHCEIVENVKKEEKLCVAYFKEDNYYQFEEIYLEYKSNLTDDLILYGQTSTSSPVLPLPTQHNTSEVRLPQIHLPKFSGVYEEWQTFYNMYNSLIHNNNALSGVQKLYYLKSCLTGEPENLLKNLSTTETNYAEAFKLLTRRYNNKQLFSQRNATVSSNAINQLLDTTSSSLKAPENIGIDTSSWDAMVNYLDISQLDPDSRKEWEVKMERLARARGSASALLKRTPSWVQRIETHFNVLPAARQGASQAAQSELPDGRGRNRRGTPGSPAEVLQLLVSQCRRHGALCSGRMYRELRHHLKAGLSVGELHATWVNAQRVSLLQLAARCRRGDAADAEDGQAAADAALRTVADAEAGQAAADAALRTVADAEDGQAAADAALRTVADAEAGQAAADAALRTVADAEDGQAAADAALRTVADAEAGQAAADAALRTVADAEDGQAAADAALRTVADLVLLHTDVDAHRLLTDESVTLFAELEALRALLALVARHGAEGAAARDLPRRWAALLEEYRAGGRTTSAVVLQRRWHELKLQTRERMLALGAACGDVPAPAAIHIDVARKFPQVVLKPVDTWSQLVADGRVYAPFLLQTDNSTEDGDKQDGGGKANGDTAQTPIDSEDDDVQLIEQEMETIDVESCDSSTDDASETHADMLNEQELSADDTAHDDIVTNTKYNLTANIYNTNVYRAKNCKSAEAAGGAGARANTAGDIIQNNDDLSLLESLDPKRVNTEIIFDSDSESDSTERLNPPNSMPSRITFDSEHVPDSETMRSKLLSHIAQAQKRKLRYRGIRKRSLYSYILGADKDGDIPAAKCAKLTESGANVRVGPKSRMNKSPAQTDDSPVDPKLVMDTRVNLIDFKYDKNLMINNTNVQMRTIAEHIYNSIDNAPGTSVTDSDRTGQGNHSTLIEGADGNTVDGTNADDTVDTFGKCSVSTRDDVGNSRIGRTASAAEPAADVKEEHCIEIEIEPLAKCEPEVEQSAPSDRIVSDRRSDRDGSVSPPAERDGDYEVDSTTTSEDSERGAADTRDGRQGRRRPAGPRPAKRRAAAALHCPPALDDGSRAGSKDGSRDGSRVAKRVELPDIEEVRRVNSCILTAQVAPISAPTYAADGRTRVSADGDVTADAADGAIATRGQLDVILNKLTAELRLRANLGGRGYCCAARRHRSVNDARKRICGDAPDLPLHRHESSACTCCCRHLTQQSECRAALRAAAQALLAELARLVRPQYWNGKSKRASAVSASAPDAGRSSPSGVAEGVPAPAESAAGAGREPSGPPAGESGAGRRADDDRPATDDAVRRSPGKRQKCTPRATRAKKNRSRRRRRRRAPPSLAEEEEDEEEEEKPSYSAGLAEWERQKTVNEQFFKINVATNVKKRRKPDEDGDTPAAAPAEESATYNPNEAAAAQTANDDVIVLSDTDEEPASGLHRLHAAGAGQVESDSHSVLVTEVKVPLVGYKKIVRLQKNRMLKQGYYLVDSGESAADTCGESNVRTEAPSPPRAVHISPLTYYNALRSTAMIKDSTLPHVQLLSPKPTRLTICVNKQLVPQTTVVKDQPASPTIVVCDQTVSPTTIVCDQLVQQTTVVNDQPAQQTTVVDDQTTSPATDLSDQPAQPTTDVKDQPASPITVVCDQTASPTTIACDQPVQQTTAVNNQSIPEKTVSNPPPPT